MTVDPAATPVEHARASLDQRLQALLAHEPGTRTGQDIEDLHQMRVAVRRMRATLKAAQPLLDTAWADDLRAELGWLGGALGPVRDLDVLLLRLHREIAGLPTAEQSAGGVLLDNTYTGKAMAGLIQLIKDGTFMEKETVLFWHTGGLPAVFR